VPEYTDLRQWSDRIKKKRTAAISGYIFFELSKLNYGLININPFTRNVVKAHGSPVKILDKEILLLKESLSCFTKPNSFEFGDYVKIHNGPFKNKKGIVEFSNENKITVLLNSVRVNLSLSSSKLSVV
jgi:transcription antitermination factor NusG